MAGNGGKDPDHLAVIVHINDGGLGQILTVHGQRNHHIVVVAFKVEIVLRQVFLEHFVNLDPRAAHAASSLSLIYRNIFPLLYTARSACVNNWFIKNGKSGRKYINSIGRSFVVYWFPAGRSGGAGTNG